MEFPYLSIYPVHAQQGAGAHLLAGRGSCCPAPTHPPPAPRLTPGEELSALGAGELWPAATKTRSFQNGREREVQPGGIVAAATGETPGRPERP